MSRTYRNFQYKGRKYWVDTCASEEEIVWEDAFKVSEDFTYSNFDCKSVLYKVVYYRNSKTAKKRLSITRSDAKTWTFKEPGPSWFRNLYEERPLRRKSKQELLKFIRNPEYEPIIDAKSIKREYWT